MRSLTLTLLNSARHAGVYSFVKFVRFWISSVFLWPFLSSSQSTMKITNNIGFILAKVKFWTDFVTNKNTHLHYKYEFSPRYDKVNTKPQNNQKVHFLRNENVAIFVRIGVWLQRKKFQPLASVFTSIAV